MSKTIAQFEIQLQGKNISVVQKDLQKTRKEIDKTSESAKKGGKQVDKYGRGIKGAAGISSGASKNFSKMQQNIGGNDGSGGLVRAYALLAANVFALTAAFGVLQRSAQIDQLTASMEILSTRGGTSIDVLSRKIVEASGGAVDLASAFRQVSLASSAGLNTEEIEGLTMVAKGAAISLGRDLPDAMDRIFRGAIKLEPEILDEIGLFVRVDEAARTYAQGLGRTVTSLSQADKRQAFLNAILDQGTKKFKQYAETIEPDAFTQLAAALRDIAQNLTSFFNQGLGPLVNFLADNTGLLTGIFVLVAGSLLRQAIPAIGQFNSQVAEGAVLAQQEAAEYIKGVEKKSLAATKSQRKIATAEKNTAKAQAEAARASIDGSKRFKSQAKAAGDIEDAIKGATTATKKHAAVLKKQKQLREAELKVQAKSKKLIQDELKLLDLELAALQKQIQAEREINRLKKGAKTQAGSLAARTTESLAQGAAVAGGVSLVSGLAETQGLSAGFEELTKVFRTGEVTIDGTTTKLKGLRKFSFLARGGISILAVGIQGLMAAAGPFLLVGAALGAVLYGIGKAAGVGREESKKLGETLKDTSSIAENLQKRFEAQTKAMNDQELTYLEQIKATKAFNTQLAEVSTQILKINEEFEAFNDTSNVVTRTWQGFLSIFNMDKASQVIRIQSGLIQDSIEGLADAGDEALANRLIEIVGADTKTLALLRERNKLEVDYAKSRELIIENNIKSQPMEQARLQFSQSIRAGKSESEAAQAVRDLRKEFKDLTDEQIISMVNGKRLNKRIDEISDALGGFKVDTDKAKLAAEALGQVFDERAKRLGSFISSVEGANEAIGKFQSSFLPKTKADEIIGSLTGITESMDNLLKPIIGTEGDLQGQTLLDQALDPKKVQEFIASLDDADNPLQKLFTKEERAALEESLNMENTKEGMEAAKKVIEAVTTEFLEFQFTIIASKSEIARLNTEIKMMNTFAKAGADVGKNFAQAQVDLAKQNKQVAETNYEMSLRSAKVSKEDGVEIAKAVKNAKTHADLKKTIADFGITETQALAIAAGLQEVQLKELDEAVKLKQQGTLEDQKQAEALMVQMKAAEKRFAIEKKTNELTSQIKRLGVGITDPIKAADVQLQNAVKEVKMKQDSFKLQARLQQIQFKLLQLELDVLKEKGIITEAERKAYTDDIKKASEDLTESLNASAKNAGLEFIKTVVESGGSAQKGLIGIAQNLASKTTAKEARLKELQKELDDPDTDTKRAEQINQEIEALNNLNLGYIALKDTLRATGEQMKKFGPDGEYAASIAIGMANILDGVDKLSLAFDENSGAMERGAAIAEFASTALSSISNMMQMNSQAQIAAVDSQIAAEKKRDGKSAESIAKINALEKKKEAIARKNFERQKKMQMAQAVMSTAAAIMQTAASNLGAPWAFPLMATMAAMGAMQLAVISKQKYNGPTASTAEVNSTSLTIGKRGSAVDTARAATAGELNYLRGGRTEGTNLGGAGGNLPGASMGRKGYANGGEGIMVGERGPEVITPAAPVDITPNFALGGGETNVNFTINAVDAAGVEDVLMNQRGNLIRMIRDAANENGERFLETVDTQAYGGNK